MPNETPLPGPTKSFSGKSRCPHGFYGDFCKKCHPWKNKKWGAQASKTATEKGKAQTAKARAAALARKAEKAGKIVHVLLQFRHYVNGTAYGPGTVVVAPDLAALLREQEQRHLNNEQRLHESRSGIIVPSSYGSRVRRVAPEMFDQEFLKYFV